MMNLRLFGEINKTKTFKDGVIIIVFYIKRFLNFINGGTKIGLIEKADELIYFFYLSIIFNCKIILKTTKIMRKLVIFILLLTISMALFKDYCTTSNCRPAKRTKSCPDYYCYQCDQNEKLNINTLQCDCIQGFYRVNGRCAQCPPGYQYDEITQWCDGINPCSVNQILVNGVCQCQPGLIVIQNICQRCPVNQTYFPEYDACRCSDGLSLINNTCIRIVCGLNQEYSASKQACICTIGYVSIKVTVAATATVPASVTQICSRCKNTEVYNAATLACEPFVAPECDFNEYFYECCCFCQEGFIRINGKCSTCPTNSHYVERLNACVCEQGYYFVGQQVKQSPYFAQDTSSSYTSNPGYIYSAYGPSYGPGQSGSIQQFSNYDQQSLPINVGSNQRNILDSHNGH